MGFGVKPEFPQNCFSCAREFSYSYRRQEVRQIAFLTKNNFLSYCLIKSSNHSVHTGVAGRTQGVKHEGDVNLLPTL